MICVEGVLSPFGDNWHALGENLHSQFEVNNTFM